jgi:hypothetical protein
MRALAEAIELGRRGIPAFPCAESNKRPTCPDGFYNAETDANALRELWRRHPGQLVGVPTGPASGIDALDIDRKSSKPEAVAWWREHKDRIPTTRMHRTRSGGLHCLFQSYDGLRCSAGKLAPGVDVRAPVATSSGGRQPACLSRCASYIAELKHQLAALKTDRE